MLENYRKKFNILITTILSIFVFFLTADCVSSYFPFGNPEFFLSLHLNVSKIIYITSSVTVIASIFLFYYLLNKYIKKSSNNIFLYRLFYGLMSIMLVYSIVKIDFRLFFLALDKLVMYKSMSMLMLSAFIFFITYLYFSKKSFVYLMTFSKQKILYLFVLLISLYMAQFALLYDYHQYNANALNFSIVMHPVVQVFFGKAVLINMKTQYGLYAQLLEPIFILWNGIDIFKFSVVMATLLFATLVSVGVFLLKVVNNKILALVGWFAYIYFHFFAGTLWPYELYYQYYPIRIIFPAITLLLSYFYIKNVNLKTYIQIIFLLSIGIIWNLDVGLFSFLAFVAADSYYNLQNLSKKNLYQKMKKIVMNWFIAAVVFGFTFFSFIFYLNFRYGEWPIISELFSAQKLFLSGSVIKLNRLWTLVVLVYLVGMVVSAKYLICGKKSIKGPLIFLTSVLGIGLFTYHLNNPHDATLTNSGYMSVIVLTIMLDNYALKKKGVGIFVHLFENLIIFLSLAALSFLAASFFLNFKEGNTVKNFVTYFQMKHPKISDDRAVWERKNEDGSGTTWIFVSDLVKGYDPEDEPSWLKKSEYASKLAKRDGSVRDDMLILSNWDYLLYMKAKAKSPIISTNFRHLYLKEEWEILFDLIKNKEVKYILVDNAWGLFKGELKNHQNKYIEILSANIEENYEVKEVVKTGYTWYLDHWYEDELVLYQKK